MARSPRSASCGAAHDAFVVTALVEAGVIGATQAFEGEYGLLHAYSPSPDPAKLTDKLGETWLTMKTGIKPYPSCRLTHAAIDEAIQLRSKVPADKRADAKLTVEVNGVGDQIVGGTESFKITPRSIVDAQFSVYYQTAAAWLDGKMDWKSYDRLHDKVLLNVTKNMTLKVNKELPDGGAIVTIDGVDGASLRIDVATGDPANWMGTAPNGYSTKASIPLPTDKDIGPDLLKDLALSHDLNVSRMLAGTLDMYPGAKAMVQAVFQAKDIDPRLRELIILRSAYLLNCPYEWQANVAMAKNTGCTQAEIDAMTSDGNVTGIDARTDLVMLATDEVTKLKLCPED